MASKVEHVLALARKSTQTTLGDGQLSSVLMSLPAAFVAVADSHFDESERRYVLSMCNSIVEDAAGTDSDRSFLAAEAYATMLLLLEHRRAIEGPLMEAMREELGRDPSFGGLLDAMLVGVAEASDGISAVEQAEIDRIRTALRI